MPEGTEVTVLYNIARGLKKPVERKRVEFPLVRSKRPGTLKLTAERVAKFLDEEDVSP